jgi:hypothetical protein
MNLGITIWHVLLNIIGCKVDKSPIVPMERKKITNHFSTNQLFLWNKVANLSLFFLGLFFAFNITTRDIN